MTKTELEKLAEKYQKKADSDYRTYQQTGITRYETSRRKNEELAEAFQMAVQAADERIMLARLRSSLAILAREAECAKLGAIKPDVLLDDLLSVARESGVYR